MEENNNKTFRWREVKLPTATGRILGAKAPSIWYYMRDDIDFPAFFPDTPSNFKQEGIGILISYEKRN